MLNTLPVFFHSRKEGPQKRRKTLDVLLAFGRGHSLPSFRYKLSTL